MKETTQACGEEFTIGICATGESSGLPRLVECMLNVKETGPFLLRKLVVVTSACPDEIIHGLRELRRRDDRVDMVVEEERRGKADAINKILTRTQTPIVVLVNADSRPEPGAMGKLLATLHSDQSVGAISALPVPGPSRGPISLLLDLMWSSHNRCSISLNHMNVSNHSSDELVLFRSSAIAKLPTGLVNDGAYLAAIVRRKGYTVKVCPSAKVHVKTPRRPLDVILQRRRILFGHTQVWRKVGSPPKTIESLLFLSPVEGMRLLVGTLAEKPRFLGILPIALVSEMSAAILSILDTIYPSTSHAIWKRFT